MRWRLLELWIWCLARWIGRYVGSARLSRTWNGPNGRGENALGEMHGFKQGENETALPAMTTAVHTVPYFSFWSRVNLRLSACSKPTIVSLSLRSSFFPSFASKYLNGHLPQSPAMWLWLCMRDRYLRNGTLSQPQLHFHLKTQKAKSLLLDPQYSPPSLLTSRRLAGRRSIGVGSASRCAFVSSAAAPRSCSALFVQAPQ